MSKKIIIVGAGQAACSCAAKIRENDHECEILLIGNENFLPYQRPPLSKKYATGDMVAEQLLLRPQDWYETNGIECKTGICVTEVDVAAKSVSLSNGTKQAYDKLVLATGSRARKLPDSIGGGLENVYVLRDLADADLMAKALAPDKRVVIVGGGYIGLEAAAVCASKGMNVTLIEAAERILQRVACPQTSDWFRKLHKDNGVNIIEGVGLDRIEGADNRAKVVHLPDGREIETDFVLVGIGILPNVELAEKAGLIIEGGIVVNEHCQTSNPDIYAAGDCAVFPFNNISTRLESVQNAIDQAECVADNICGNSRSYQPHPWFWSDQYHVKLQIAGLNRGYDRVVVRPGEREGSMAHFYFAGEQMLAVDAMNDPRTYMVAKKMLEQGRNIAPEQAAEPSLVLKDLL